MSVRAASSHNTADRVITSNGKQYVYNHAHNSFVFYSCKSHLRIDLALIPLLGNGACNSKKFLRSHKIYPWRCIATRGGSVSTYPRRPLAEAFHNAVDLVEQSFELHRSSVERTAPPSSTHVQLGDVPRLLDPARRRGSNEFRQHDAVGPGMVN